MRNRRHWSLASLASAASCGVSFSGRTLRQPRVLLKDGLTLPDGVKRLRLEPFVKPGPQALKRSASQRFIDENSPLRFSGSREIAG